MEINIDQEIEAVTTQIKQLQGILLFLTVKKNEMNKLKEVKDNKQPIPKSK